MSCERYATAIADHACGADLAPDVAAHLESCPACAGQLVRDRRAIEGLDTELQQMLAIEPSPFFTQRVQAHITTAPAKQSFRGWLWMAAAAAGAIVLAVLFLTADRQQAPAIPVQTLATPAPATPVREQPVPVVVKESPAPIRRVAPRPAEAERRTVAREPEVLVPAGQMQAVARYMALMRSGKLDTSSLDAKAKADPVPTELVLDALEVRPITVKELDGTTSSAVEQRHE
jgi:hypothetical protein